VIHIYLKLIKLLENGIRPVLHKRFSTATQFLERQSIATHIALLGKKKVVLKNKTKYFYVIEYNFTKNLSISHNEACVIGALVSGYC
jgi:hypothetical protein